ncbi:MAG: STAS domain-containing protein [Pseudomonadota bacterium]
MSLNVEDLGHLIVLTFTCRRLDAATADDFRVQAREAVHDRCRVYILDLSKLSFVDSSGIGAIVGLLKFLGRERRLELCGLSPTVRKVFRLTRLEKIFTIRGTRAKCVSAYDSLRSIAS